LCNIQKNYVSNLLIRLMALLEKMNKIHDCWNGNDCLFR
jgi:hypothetical protein